jgi:glyoxylase-like metal-dependent hydrolase (beta-lactamase superfamily II)
MSAHPGDAQSDIHALSAVQAQAWKDRVMPPPEQIAEGTWAIPVPIPNNPLRYTYSYALAADTGVAIIDPGWDGKERLQAFTDGLAAAGFALQDIIGITVTHYHRDHLGLVPAILAENPDAWVALHRHDIEAVSQLISQGGAPNDVVADGGRLLGIPAERAAEFSGIFTSPSSQRGDSPMAGFAWPAHILTVDEGELLPVPGRSVRVMWTPGHTFGHIALHDEALGVFFSGDHVLPSISPNIGLDVTSISHSLGDYLGSLERMGRLPETTAVAPAHGYRFEGLRIRADQLRSHHDQRLAELRARAEETDDHSVYSLCQGMHWARGFESLTGFQLYAALMETAAHMHYAGFAVPEVGQRG